MADATLAGQVSARLNTLAVVGFVLSLLCLPLIGLVLGLLARSQIKRTGERGMGLAVAAIVLGLIPVAALLVVTLLQLVILL